MFLSKSLRKNTLPQWLNLMYTATPPEKKVCIRPNWLHSPFSFSLSAYGTNQSLYGSTVHTLSTEANLHGQNTVFTLNAWCTWSFYLVQRQVSLGRTSGGDGENCSLCVSVVVSDRCNFGLGQALCLRWTRVGFTDKKKKEKRRKLIPWLDQLKS